MCWKKRTAATTEGASLSRVCYLFFLFLGIDFNKVGVAVRAADEAASAPRDRVSVAVTVETLSISAQERFWFKILLQAEQLCTGILARVRAKNNTYLVHCYGLKTGTRYTLIPITGGHS